MSDFDDLVRALLVERFGTPLSERPRASGHVPADRHQDTAAANPALGQDRTRRERT